MRLLFFPNDSGGGLGHIGMAMALAREAVRRGHQCAFVLSDDKFLGVLKSSFKVFRVKRAHAVKLAWEAVKKRLVPPGDRPVFTEISKIDYILLRDGLADPESLERKFRNYVRVVEKFLPDRLVGDTDLLVSPLAQKCSIHSAQVVRYLSHPRTAQLIWWKNVPSGLQPPNVAGLLNALLEKNGLPAVSRTEDLLRADAYLVPGIPAVEPIPPAADTHFLGGLLDGQGDACGWRGMDDWASSGPLVYLTAGAGAIGGANKALFSSAIEAFRGKPFRLVISTGRVFRKDEFPGLPENVRVFPWVPGRSMIGLADLVIFHGGYATLMEVLASGKPSVIIPFQTEQESNGRRLEQLGCARVVRSSNEVYTAVERRWEYGSYNYLVQKNFELASDELFRQVETVFNDPSYRANARRVGEQIRSFGGAATGVQALERLGGMTG